MSEKVKGWIIKTGIAVVVVAAFALYFALIKGPDNYYDKYKGVDLSQVQSGLGRDNTYSIYLKNHADKASQTSGQYEIKIDEYTDGEGIKFEASYEGKENVLITEEKSSVTYKVEVPVSGFYNVMINYFPIESRGVDIERGLYINGELPFYGADLINFTRIWGDESLDIRKDNQGNEIRQTQIEKGYWQDSYMKDYMGYFSSPYKFYLEAGENEITIEGVSEPMAISEIVIEGITENTTYKDYIANATIKTSPKDYLQVIQGERALYRSSPSLYPTYDRSSSTTEPYNIKQITLNMIGGNAWRSASQWIEFEVDVEEDGLYNISLKGRQNFNRGFVSSRSLYIDGEIPFDEASIIEFSYNNKWQMTTLSDENGEAFLFPLTAGKHKIRFEVTLGDLGEILNRIEESVFRLNEIYRSILVLTGTEPDKYRDYNIDKIYPELIEQIDLEAKILFKIVDDLIEYSGEKGAQVASAETLAIQLERFAEKPHKIPLTLANFKNNISALGNSLSQLSQSPLAVDYIVISSPDAKLPSVKETFMQSALHEIRSFAASFSNNYNNVGNVYAEEDSIEVWILTGRDQSTILKALIDDTFTSQYGIGVNTKLVGPEAVMPAVVAGTGPDVVVSTQQGEPVNYALRGAAEDLSKYEGFNELITEYYDSAIEPFRYDGGVYGLPETQYFNVMFYRTDVFEELELTPPDTWDELIAMFSKLNNNNMEVGIPSVERKINNIKTPDLSNFFAQLYQRGGNLYNDEQTEILLATPVAVEAFEIYTKFFTHYKVPQEYDFVNRFRTGEMPIGFVDYNNYNTLAVSAPEIRGLWEFALLPGVEQEDGSINRATSSWSTATMMIASSEKKEAAWKFIRWWMGADAQVAFGREMEALMGASARYATANKLAFDQLPWSTDEAAIIKEQWEWIKGTPEVAGGYYTSRNIVNAVRRVMTKSTDTRETLLDYAITINQELEKKQLEFGIIKEK